METDFNPFPLDIFRIVRRNFGFAFGQGHTVEPLTKIQIGIY
jgi:hypothetical protein